MYTRILVREKLHLYAINATKWMESQVPRLSNQFERTFPEVISHVRWPYFNGAHYDRFLPLLERLGIFDLDGDILEIGAFVGVGTVKLAIIGQRHGKRVFAIDVFELGADLTRCSKGGRMNDYYTSDLGGHALWDAYKKNVQSYSDIVTTLRGDSISTNVPRDLRLCFAFIDGNHDPAYVRNDFFIAWTHMVSGVVVGFDDYGYDLPQDTAVINKLMEEHGGEISDTWRLEPKQIFLHKR